MKRVSYTFDIIVMIKKMNECKKNFLTILAGYECWDHVSVWSCWGRCDSREISDWKFPYKKSYHPVCVHAGRSKAVATLRHCHPLADSETRLYEYLEATSCHCQTCTTLDTSCEAPNNIRHESSVKVLALAGVGPDDLDY